MDTQSDNASPAGDYVETTRSFARYLLVIVAITLVLVIPAALTLQCIQAPPGAVFDPVTQPNPSPYGYTASLSFFLLPIAVLLKWFSKHPECRIEWQAFLVTVGILAPTGILLDLVLGLTFFQFPNQKATLGLRVPGYDWAAREWVGDKIPVEEFLFYILGFLAILLMYIWCDQHWCARYNVTDYRKTAIKIEKLIEPLPWSVFLAFLLVLVACLLRWYETGQFGYPGYFIFLVSVAFLPTFCLFHTAAPYVNWRALGFSLFLLPLISLIWEVTLGLPYGWWDFNTPSLIGTRIRAWSDLPVEEPILWLCTTWTTVILYEFLKVCFYRRSGNSQPPAIPPINPRRDSLTVLAMMAVLIAPTVLTMWTVKVAARPVEGDNPSPFGYSWSLTLFLIPCAALAFWAWRRLKGNEMRALFYTATTIAGIGIFLDYCLGTFFFDFKNPKATLGYHVRGVIPIEEFVFYILGGFVVLLTYIWGDMFWLAKYNVPDYHGQAKTIRRALGFAWVAAVVVVLSIGLAFVYKKFGPHEYQEGWPGYCWFLVLVALFPTVAMFQAVRPFVNWQAFSFAFFLLLLVSLLWEATLGLPYRWWGYHEDQMMGIMIRPWVMLPIEAVFVWLVTAWITVSLFEFLKILFYSGKPLRHFCLGEPGKSAEAP